MAYRPESAGSPRTVLRTIVLASLGGALEFYDFVIFVFFTAAISDVFFPASVPAWLRQLQTFGIFAAGYLARPLGGIILSHFGDRRGRKGPFALSVFLMAVPTLLIGILPTYKNAGIYAPLLLLFLRMMQGAAIGGEAPGGWVFVAEHAPAHRQGLAVGLLTSGLTAGILLGSLASLSISLAFTPSQIEGGVWRLPFILGGLAGLVSMQLRRWLAETPVFEAMRAQRTHTGEIPLRVLLREHKLPLALSALSTWTLTAAILVNVLMAPVILRSAFSLPISQIRLANLAATVLLCFSVIATGLAVDRFSLRSVAVPAYLFLIAASYALFLCAAREPSLLIPAYALAGVATGAATLTPILMVQAFPAHVRFSGISFSYNVAYALAGGVTPLLVAWLAHYNRTAPATYVAFATLLGLATACLFPRGSSDRQDGRASLAPVVTKPRRWIAPSFVEAGRGDLSIEERKDTALRG